MLHIFVGEDAEREGILFAKLRNLTVHTLTYGLRTAAALLGLQTTLPLSTLLRDTKLANIGLRDCVVCDITDKLLLERVMLNEHVIHGEFTEDVALNFVPGATFNECPIKLACLAIANNHNCETAEELEELFKDFKPEI